MKLTKAMRDELEKRIMRRRFDEADAALEWAEEQLSLDVYNSLPRIAEIDTLPDGWFPERAEFRSYFGGELHICHLPEPRRIPHFVGDWKLRFAADHPLAVRRQAIQAEHHNKELLKKEVRSEIQRAVRDELRRQRPPAEPEEQEYPEEQYPEEE